MKHQIPKYFSNTKVNVAGLGINLGGKMSCVKAVKVYFLLNPVVF